MTNTQLFVPKTIKVGYDSREDTYTGKLAYIIYIDEKGKVRKETSWNNWRDHKLGDDSFENIPTEGFVINKNVGGYSSGWNHRQSYIRVYDPRGFEFEITLENLLFIIENTSLITGKGIEGEFVYGWDGKDLVLIPCKSPDYIKIEEYNQLIRSEFKLTAKTIKVGVMYRNDKQEDLVYVGRYDKYENFSSLKEVEVNKDKFEISSNKIGKKYWFYNIELDTFVEYNSLGKFKMIVNDEPLSNTSELIEKLFKQDELQHYTIKNTIAYPLNNEDNLNKLLELVNRKLSGSYDNNSIVYLYDKDKNLKYYLQFEKDYKHNHREKKTRLHHKVKFAEYVIRLNSNHYGRKERSINKDSKLEEYLDIKEYNLSDYSYKIFQNYKMNLEDLKSKFTELIFDNESFRKDLYFLEFVSETNEDVTKIPVDYYLNLIFTD